MKILFCLCCSVLVSLPPPPYPSPSQTVSTASELRKPIYWIVAAKAIDYEQMLLMMSGVKWDIREIMSQHNVYVDILLKVNGLKRCLKENMLQMAALGLLGAVVVRCTLQLQPTTGYSKVLFI